MRTQVWSQNLCKTKQSQKPCSLHLQSQHWRGRNGGSLELPVQLISSEFQISETPFLTKQEVVPEEEGHLRATSCLYTHTQRTHTHSFEHRERRERLIWKCMYSLKSCDWSLSVNQVYFFQRLSSRLDYFRAIGNHENQRDMVDSFPIDPGGNKSGFSYWSFCKAFTRGCLMLCAVSLPPLTHCLSWSL